MPIYDYVCDNCGFKLLDIYQSIKEEPLSLCDKCNTNALSRIIYSPMLAKTNEPKTLGTLAERNSSKMSNDEKQQTVKETDSLQHLGKGMSIKEKRNAR